MTINTFDNEKLAQQIYELGVDVDYYQGIMCSCRADNHGQPDPNCGCMAGFRYKDPITYRLLRTSVYYKDLPAEAGLIYLGGCQFAINRIVVEPDAQGNYQIVNDALPIYDTIGFGDVLVVTSRTRRDKDILRRGVRDSIWAFDVQSIVSISQGATFYAEGTDFVLNGTAIEWETGKGPQSGEAYSVEYLCKLQYVVWDDLAKDRGTETVILPKRILCRLRQYVNFEAQGLNLFSS